MTALPDVPGVRHLDVDLPTGVRLHVAEAGPADGPVVLAVHGWPQHWWMWRDVIGPLSGTHRVLCPDLRGLGWSGHPDDGRFTKPRLADDILALLDELGIARAGYLGHDWGGWTGWLVALRAPERISRLMAVSIVHPWADRRASALNAWRLAYQVPLATPGLGPALVRDGRVLLAMLRPAMGERAARVYTDVLRDPARAEASSRLYRDFQLRDLPDLLRGRLDDARLEIPAKVLFGRGDGAQHPSQLRGLPERADAQLDVEVVDGHHFLVDQRPELVADRAAAWFG